MRLFSAFATLVAFALLAADPAAAAPELPALTVAVEHLAGFTAHADAGAIVGAALAIPGAVAVPAGTRQTILAKLKAFFGEGREAEAEAALNEVIAEQDAPAAPSAPPSPSQPAPPTDLAAQIAQAVQAALAPVQAELATVKDALGAEATARKEAQTALETQRSKERAAEVEKALDAAVTDGRITPAKRDDWKARLENDFDTVGAILAEMPANPALSRQPAQAKPGDGGKSAETAPALAGLRPDALAYVTEGQQN